MAGQQRATPYSWEHSFEESLSQGDVAGAIQALYKTTHADGRRHPRAGEFRRARTLLIAYVPDADRRWQWGVQLIEDSLCEILGIRLVIPFLSERPDEVAEVFLRLADDADWERRESAAWMLSELFLADFDSIHERCLGWVRHPSENVRRAVAVGVKIAAKARVPNRGEKFLDLIDPLMSDRSVYVRRNLGPFAIGDGLLRYYPAPTLIRLAMWAAQPDEQTRWNVAMAFSAAEGANQIEAALPILTDLAIDERRCVWRAVASAMRNLGRRRPEQTLPVLEAWAQDPSRRQAAKAALRYLRKPEG